MITDDPYWSEIKVKKKYVIAVFIPIFLVFIYYAFFSTENQTSRIEFAKNLFKSNFTGIVVRKYVTWSNHNEHVVEIQINSRIQRLSGFDWSNIYNLSYIGDTIIKNADEKVIIIRNGNRDTIADMVEYYQDALKIKNEK